MRLHTFHCWRCTGHRYNIAIGRQGITHSPETKAKISAAVSATKRKLRRQRLAARAAAFAEEATADLRPAFAMASTGEADGDEEDMADSEEAPLQLDMLELEKLVIEVTALRRQLTAWMDAYEKSEHAGTHDVLLVLPHTAPWC